MGEPVFIGLLFADRIITETNGKKGIIGTFNQFNAHKFPAVFPPWGIYAAVTNLQGEHEFSLNLVRDSADQVILPMSGKFEVKHASDVVELCPQVGGVMFPAEGKYVLTFSIDGHLIGTRILSVNLVKDPRETQ